MSTEIKTIVDLIAYLEKEYQELCVTSDAAMANAGNGALERTHVIAMFGKEAATLMGRVLMALMKLHEKEQAPKEPLN